MFERGSMRSCRRSAPSYPLKNRNAAGHFVSLAACAGETFFAPVASSAFESPHTRPRMAMIYATGICFVRVMVMKCHVSKICDSLQARPL